MESPIQRQKIGIALGSNLGDRRTHLRRAIEELRNFCASEHFLVSSFYETEPVDCPPESGRFLNAVVELESADDPFSILQTLQTIEQSFGRPANREKSTPRTLDLDILYYGNLEIDHPDLCIPHPQAVHREFVLKPLAEIHPDLILPGQSHSISELLSTHYESID